jgi:hypothetical protein
MKAKMVVLAIGAMIVVGSGCASNDEDGARSDASRGSMPTISDAGGEIDAGSEMARNLVWTEVAMEDSQRLESLFGEISSAGGAGDVARVLSACAQLVPASESMADHAPDTQAGRHARSAANLFREAAHACLDLEAEVTAELISAGSDEIAKATELIAASTSGVAG